MNDIERLNIVRNLQNRVYEIIRNYVVRPEIPPGIRLYEEKLSKEIGVSRTPVRIALSRLDREGLIRITPNRGTFKTHFSWEEVVEIMKLRQLIECLALDMGRGFDKDQINNVAKSIPNENFFETSGGYSRYPDMDQQFHMELLKISKRQWLLKVVEHLDPVFHMLRLITLQENERIKSSIEEHEKIVNELKLNDITAAITSLEEHWNSALKALEQRHRSIPGLFL